MKEVFRLIMTQKYDYIIVGAGLAGATFAERLSKVCENRVLVIEKKNHIGGLCYDYVDECGTIVHRYGPHIYHNSNRRVHEYLSQFTKWNAYNHKVLYQINELLVPIPFNMISIDKLMGEDAENIKKVLLDTYDANTNIELRTLINSKDPCLRKLGRYVYNIHCSDYRKLYELSDEKICELMDTMPPVRVSYDCRYYNDLYQGVPAKTYSQMFTNMLNSDRIDVELNTDYKDMIKVDFENSKIYYKNREFDGHLIFTGRLDEFFSYRYGKLPYRSSAFSTEKLKMRLFQNNAVIYNTDRYHFRRITEFKHITGQQTFNTTIQFDFPEKYIEGQTEALYPINTKRNMETYEKYKKESLKLENVTFAGRLANYKNMSMNEVVMEALESLKSMNIIQRQ